MKLLKFAFWMLPFKTGPSGSTADAFGEKTVFTCGAFIFFSRIPESTNVLECGIHQPNMSKSHTGRNCCHYQSKPRQRSAGLWSDPRSGGKNEWRKINLSQPNQTSSLLLGKYFRVQFQWVLDRSFSMPCIGHQYTLCTEQTGTSVALVHGWWLMKRIQQLCCRWMKSNLRTPKRRKLYQQLLFQYCT